MTDIVTADGSVRPEQSAQELTVDELAVRTGTTVRNIRYYTEQGLLPPPERRGRMAFYGPQHRMRLELARQLQDHGYTLSAIGKVLARLPDAARAEDLAVRASLLTPWNTADGEPVDRLTLEQRVGRPLTDQEIDTLVAAGVVRRRTGAMFTVGPDLAAAAEILAMDIPPRLFALVGEALERHVAALVGELVELGMAELFDGADLAASMRQAAVALPHFRPVLLQSLIGRFTTAMDAAIQDTLAGLAEPPNESPAKEVPDV